MSFFDDDNSDPFEEIVNQFFGGKRRPIRKTRSFTENEENTDTVEEKDYIYRIIEIPGYQKEDLKVEVKNDILIITISKKDRKEEMQKDIPNNAIKKKFNYTYTNGILEVKFSKK